MTKKTKKRTPIKEIKKTPTRERLNISTTHGKNMYLTILRGTKLGWGYFLRARPDTYEDLRHVDGENLGLITTRFKERFPQ